jgi:ABC-type sugar transport system ATPase subunit
MQSGRGSTADRAPASPGGPPASRPGSGGDRAACALVANGLYKHYAGVHALEGASLEVLAGEVHGLIGENGSGKSTLLKILAGQTLSDRADIVVAGKPLVVGHPALSLAAGIATVTQETTLVEELSVAENILLGRRAVRRWYGLDRPATERRAREVLERLDLEIDPRTPVRHLRPDERQMVEIARAISMDVRVLILDEPTSSLTDEEVETLFRVVVNLRARGVATIFVSHRLKEVFELTDRVTVLRDGKTVATERTEDVDSDRLIELMVGKRPERHSAPVKAGASGELRLRVQDLSVPGRVRGVSLDVAPGEVVGLAGLVGAGRSDVLRAVFGLNPAATGSVQLDGEELPRRGAMRSMRSGLAYVPADRKEQGLVLEMSTRENLVMAQTASRARFRHPPRGREAEQVRSAWERFHLTNVASSQAPVASLSGGNQQKVVLAKWLEIEPKAILLDDPTRGVDVGAKDEIYDLLEGLRSGGLAVLVSSSDTPELLRLCDRILVMFRGLIVSELSRAEATEARIAHYATGHD